MALTAAEKMKRRREKLKKEGKYEEYKIKHKLEMKKSREKKKKEMVQMSVRKRKKMLEEERQKTKLRVAKCRQLKKEKICLKSPTVYKNPSSLSKAVFRVQQALPKSPRKKKCVVKKLYESLSSGSIEDRLNDKEKQKPSFAPDLITKVKAFYQRDDVSRQAPGMKDVISLKLNGIKEKFQVRHLYSSVRETHALFCSENPDIKIGKSKFCDLRPKHVKTSNKMPHNVCLCKYHENFILAVDALHEVSSSFPKYSKCFWETFLCKSETEDCWLRKCENCKLKLQLSMLKILENDSIPKKIKWISWKEQDDGRLKKITMEGEVEDLVNYINSMSDKFLEHVYTKREQAKSYEIDKSITQNPEYNKAVAVVQVDFAENYTCIAQREIQSYHWKQPQVSLFTVSICCHGKQTPYTFLSDNLDHTKETIVVYLTKILDNIPECVKEVRIWSDGPTSQFKNRYIVVSLKTLQEKYRKKIVWNYFATSHGKGPVDGIGGSLKRQVRQGVLSHKEIVQNADDFSKVAERVSAVNTKLVQEEDMVEVRKTLDTESLFENSDPVPGISRVHAMFWKENMLKTFPLTKKMRPNGKCIPEQIECQPSTSFQQVRQPIYNLVYSDDSDPDDPEEPEDVTDEPIEKDKITQGSFVLVKFSSGKNSSNTFKYAAICQSDVDELNDVEVMFLKHVKNSRIFKTDETDVTFVKVNQICNVLPTPEIKVKGDFFYYHFQQNVAVREV